MVSSLKNVPRLWKVPKTSCMGVTVCVCVGKCSCECWNY